MDPDEDHCRVCGEELVWGAGPACPNDCDLGYYDEHGNLVTEDADA